MSEFLKIAATVLIFTLIITSFKEVKREYSLYLAIVCGVFVVISSLDELKILKSTFDELINLSDVGVYAMKIFFKTVAITVISSLTSDACIDSGNRFLASCIELSGKIAVTVCALPLINSVVKIIISYIGT